MYVRRRVRWTIFAVPALGRPLARRPPVVRASAHRSRSCRSLTIPLRDSGGTASEVAVRARDVARHYGAGETAVHALRGVDLDVASEPPDRSDGSVGLEDVTR